MHVTAPGPAPSDTPAPAPAGERRSGRAGGTGPRRPRLVATDLDGTLLRGDSTVSARTLAALRRITDSGIRHVIVTGRPAAGCRPFFDALGYTGLAVCGQGAQIYDAGRGLLLSSATLDRDAARAVLDRLTALTGPVDLAAVTAGERGEFLVTEGFGRGDEKALRPFRPTTPAELWDEPIDKVLLRHPTLGDEDLVAAVRRCLSPGLAVTHAGPRIVELLPDGFDKGTGLTRVLQSLGLDPDDVIAFGDMPNDIPMLAQVGHAVAMANGHPELKTVAHEIAPTNDDDGVAAVLERILDEGVSC